LLFGGVAGTAIGSRTCAARNGVVFVDRGWTVTIEPVDRAWTWRAVQEGATTGEGVATSNIEAIDKARQWIGSRALPSPRPHRVPPLPPQPVGRGFPAPKPGFSAPPKKQPDIEGVGILWKPSDQEVLLTNLVDFVAVAYGSFDPWGESPGGVVESALKAALPQDWTVLAPEITIVTASGEPRSVAEVEAGIAALQSQMHSPDMVAAARPFAADILSEAIFDTEQHQSQSPFAYRGRVVVARPVPGGFIATILHAGTTTNGTEVFPSTEKALNGGREIVNAQDGV
jgi:hypothetical protein